MAMHRLAQFDTAGRLREVESWCLYAAFAPIADAHALVKVGISQTPIRRVYSVHCGSAYPVEVALWTHVGVKRNAVAIERAMHSRLSAFRTRGEWFDFDTSDQEQKQLFHAVARACFMRATGRRLQWRKSTMSEIRESLNLDSPT